MTDAQVCTRVNPQKRISTVNVVPTRERSVKMIRNIFRSQYSSNFTKTSLDGRGRAYLRAQYEGDDRFGIEVQACT